MTREEAIRLMAVYESLTASLGPVFGTRNLSTEQERKSVSQAHGRVIAAIYEECMKPIIAQFPDLDPDLDAPKQ